MLASTALEPRRAACLVLGAGSAASLASWAAGKARPAMRRRCLPAPERCPVAASRRARALREHCGGRVAPGEQIIRRDRDPPSILNRAEFAWAMVIIQEYGASR